MRTSKLFVPSRPRLSPLWALPALAAVAVSFAACESGTVDGKAVTQKAALQAEGVMHETGLAVGFAVADDGTIQKIMGSSGNAADAVAPALSTSTPPTAMLRAMVGPTMTRQMTGLQMLPSMMTPEEKFDDAGHELRRLMQERLFVDANFEGNNGDTAVYLLHADPTCRPLPADTDPPGTVPEIGAECAKDFEKVAVRIAVRADGDGAEFKVLIGPGRLELVTVTVHSDQLALQVNLPMAKAASDYVQAQLGEQAPMQSFERLMGTVRLSLKKVAPGKITAGVAIVDALDIAETNGASFTSAAADPLFAVTSDGATKTARLDIGLGATEIAGTWDPQHVGVTNRDLHVTVGGLYGHLALDEAAREIVLTDVGVGETKVAIRGNTIFDLNLNADTMRRFSGRITANTDGTARVEVTPKIDLNLAFDYAAIASDFSTPPDAALAHEAYAVSLVNGGTPAVLQNAPSTATFAGGIKIVAGTLTLAVASAPADTVTVTAGRCLTTRDPAPAGVNPILGKLVAADCN
jgi:hypothetical protein